MNKVFGYSGSNHNKGAFYFSNESLPDLKDGI